MQVRELRPTDAESLSSCFQKCYGDTYSTDVFYNIPELTAHIETGALCSVVAVTEDNLVVGHTGLSTRHVGALASEAGNTVVDPDYRGLGLLKRLGTALSALCVDRGYVGYVHYPTTAHAIMQKRSVTNGGVETGIMLAYIPATTEYKAVDQSPGRLAATIVYQPFVPAPERQVVLPERYRDQIVSLYERCDLKRTEAYGADVQTIGVVEHSFHAKRGLLQLFVSQTGDGTMDSVSELMAQTNPELVHIDLCLDCLGIDAAVEQLHANGFLYCGLLPEFARTDVLRMQYLAQSSSSGFAPDLENSDAQKLMEFIQADV